MSLNMNVFITSFNWEVLLLLLQMGNLDGNHGGSATKTDQFGNGFVFQ